MMQGVLIISGTEDAHAIHMCKVLDTKRIPYFFFPTNKYPYEAQITFDLREGFTLQYDRRQITVDNNLSIWNRRMFDPDFPDKFPKKLEDMVKEESKRTIQGLMVSHTGLVVNNPFNNHKANNKIEQLQHARNLGLVVPDTTVTNDPEKVKQFYEEHNRNIIFKMQKLPIIEEEPGVPKTVMTNRVLPEHLADIGRVRNNPCCFQERIDKEYEIRLTVIGDRLFPIAIYSQDSDISRDDFRRYDFERVKYKLVDIPRDVAGKILALTHQYGLHYATIDLIYTPKREHVFLEVNPNGQYLWTEEMSGIPITEAFADYLAGV